MNVAESPGLAHEPVRLEQFVAAPGYGRKVAARLDVIPVGLEFPPALQPRIAYDASHRQLEFRGTMSSADYFFLRKCSNDPDYVRALNELHARSAPPLWSGAKVIPAWLWGLVTASFAGAAAFWAWWLYTS